MQTPGELATRLVDLQFPKAEAVRIIGEVANFETDNPMRLSERLLAHGCVDETRAMQFEMQLQGAVWKKLKHAAGVCLLFAEHGPDPTSVRLMHRGIALAEADAFEAEKVSATLEEIRGMTMNVLVECFSMEVATAFRQAGQLHTEDMVTFGDEIKCKVEKILWAGYEQLK